MVESRVTFSDPREKLLVVIKRMKYQVKHKGEQTKNIDNIKTKMISQIIDAEGQDLLEINSDNEYLSSGTIESLLTIIVNKNINVWLTEYKFPNAGCNWSRYVPNVITGQ